MAKKKQTLTSTNVNKSKTHLSPCKAVSNPWTAISWKNTIADCDKSIINPTYCALHGIDALDLPEPYSGNFNNSNVVLLNLNPGLNPCSKAFYKNRTYFGERKNTLLQNTACGFMWFKNITCNSGCLHSGCMWWKQKTKILRGLITNRPLNLFVLEYFPYHTASSFNYPKNLPSNNFRDSLLCQAMVAQKLLVIMRGTKLWDSLINRFSSVPYTNIIKAKNPQNFSLTQNNFSLTDWNVLIKTL